MKAEHAVSTVHLLIALWFANAYHFDKNSIYHYQYIAQNALVNGNSTTLIKFQIRFVNQTETGNRLHSLIVDSFVQRTHNRIVVNNPKKWDLSKTFLFETDEKGSVTLVHCHHEDHDELLYIKKVVVSVFSVNVQIKEDSDQWDYSADDSDHLGQLQHQYQVQRTDGGLKLQRKHYSEKDAYRFHEKTMHYDHQGTLHIAEAKDRILFKDRTTDPIEMVRLPGELPHKITVSGGED